MSFSDVIRDVSGGNGRVPQSEYLDRGSLPIVDQGKDLIGGYTNDSELAFRGELPVVVFGDHTKALKFVDFPFAVGADGVKVLKPTAHLDVRYAFHFFRTLTLPNAGYSRHFKFLKETQIPLPSIGEQRGIADLLDIADTLHAGRRKAIGLLEELIRSMFLEMFGDPMTNPRGLSQRCLGEVGQVITGNTPPRSDVSNYGPGIDWINRTIWD